MQFPLFDDPVRSILLRMRDKYGFVLVNFELCSQENQLEENGER